MEVVFNIVYNSTEEGKKQAAIIRQALIAKGLKYQDKEDAISYMPADMEAYVDAPFFDQFEITAENIQDELNHLEVVDGTYYYYGADFFAERAKEDAKLKKDLKEYFRAQAENDDDDYGDEDQNDVMNVIRKHLPDDD